MPSIFTHTAVALSCGSVFKSGKMPLKFWILSIICAILPDADVIGYHYFYIASNDFFGHRGFFHSPFFAAMIGIATVSLFYRNEKPFSTGWWIFVLYFFVLAASHGILDALTNGGRGIALLSPVTNHRYFFPWTPIEVSPLAINRFLGPRGLEVLKSEMLWIWLPLVFSVFFYKIASNLRKT
jgi:inner membrane protein